MTNTVLQVAGAAIGLSGGNPDARSGDDGGAGCRSAGWRVAAFSRKHESEADYMGIFLRPMPGMIRANRWHCGNGWGKHRAVGGNLNFFSTHPSHDTRIDQLKEWMPEAMAIYQKTGSCAGGSVAGCWRTITVLRLLLNRPFVEYAWAVCLSRPILVLYTDLRVGGRLDGRSVRFVSGGKSGLHGQGAG